MSGKRSDGYDAAGRTTSVAAPNGITNIAYDWESRISTINGPGITASYTYNGLETYAPFYFNRQIGLLSDFKVKRSHVPI
jgi:YD repeat-containing protein